MFISAVNPRFLGQLLGIWTSFDRRIYSLKWTVMTMIRSLYWGRICTCQWPLRTAISWRCFLRPKWQSPDWLWKLLSALTLNTMYALAMLRWWRYPQEDIDRMDVWTDRAGEANNILYRMHGHSRRPQTASKESYTLYQHWHTLFGSLCSTFYECIIICSDSVAVLLCSFRFDKIEQIFLLDHLSYDYYLTVASSLHFLLLGWLAHFMPAGE